MVTQRTQTTSFVFLLLIALALTAFVYLPFAQVMVIAAVTAVLLSSFYQRALKIVKGREGIAAFVTCLVLLTLIVVPILLIGTQIAKETTNLYQHVNAGKDSFFIIIQREVNVFATRFLPGLSFDVTEAFKTALGAISGKLGGIFSGLVNVMGNIVLWLIATFYLLKDGHRFIDRFIELSPLTDDYDHVIVNRMEIAMHSVVRGQLLVAIIQGSLTGIGFAILGIPSAILWGVVAAFCALVPGVGTSIVIGPGILYLFLTGQIIPSIILAIWGAFAVGVIDNILGPSLIGKGANIHPLLVLFAVLGGFVAFGPLGFILGPLCVSFLIALLEIYRILILKEKGRVVHPGE